MAGAASLAAMPSRRAATVATGMAAAGTASSSVSALAPAWAVTAAAAALATALAAHALAAAASAGARPKTSKLLKNSKTVSAQPSTLNPKP